MSPANLSGPILIVEDDRNTAALVATYLQREGFATLEIHDGAQVLETAQREKPGFVILDVMLPGMDGWEICRELRKVSEVPILMLTAREEEIDRVLGLSLGADDYVVKPFSPRELVERVKAILRRVRPAAPINTEVLQHDGLTLNLAKHKVTVDDETVALTAVEYKLLYALMRSPGRVGIIAYLLAQLADVHIHHPVDHRFPMVIESVEQFLAALHAPR